MNKFTSLLIFLVFTLNVSANALLFQYDKQKVNNSLQTVTEVESNFNKTHLSYSEMQKQNPELIAKANLDLKKSSVLTNDTQLGVPSFLLGCCLGIIGLIAVIISTKQNEKEVGKATAGCLINTVGVALLLLGGLLLNICNNLDWSFSLC